MRFSSFFKLSIYAFFFAMVLIYNPAAAQNVGGSPSQADNTIYETVDEEPSFYLFNEFLQRNLKYPPDAEKDGISGSVICSFVVEKDGYLSNINVVKGLGLGCTEETLRVLRLMQPWKPGKIGGKPVRTSFSITVYFKLPKPAENN